jgi:hypothetical protein
MKRAAGILAGAMLAWTGCARDPNLCCDQFLPTEEAGIYCFAHKDAVVRYAAAGKDGAERRARVEWFKGVLKELETLPDSDAVHDRLSRFEKTRPDFWREYEKHHFWAGRDTNLGLERRGRLMVCGFRHGLRQAELDLR